MCDRAFAKNKYRITSANQCLLTDVQTSFNAQVLQQSIVLMDSDETISIKAEPDILEEGSVSVHPARWISEVVVEPTFSLHHQANHHYWHSVQPMEPNKVYQLPTLLQPAPLACEYLERGRGAERGERAERIVMPDGREISPRPLLPMPATFQCDICHRKFTRQSNLAEHTLRHGGESFQCEVCHKKFTCARYLTRHSRIHTDDGSPKKAESSRQHNKHIDKGYTCTFCEKSFSCKSHLVAHTRIHTGEKPYACDVCNKLFNHKSHLNAHTRIHTGEKPFQCRICQKPFRDPSNLAGHMRVHNGLKPFACAVCSEEFTHSSMLKKHEKLHADHKVFPCEICGKVLTDNSKLKNHMKTHAEKSMCTVCNKSFTPRKSAIKDLACPDCTREYGERIKLDRGDNGSFMIYTVSGQ
ncbi:zinc finger protein 664 isoform X2 [Plutella xylostella]|uniref:zinc finger protein 664 isoform X2 n=1 Tax=Plutella xylostella TaxID=51655 RepID=UPI002032FF4C|nr:zinc finger protein 664 isoform X2 [Plutella xylostella]